MSRARPPRRSASSAASTRCCAEMTVDAVREARERARLVPKPPNVARIVAHQPRAAPRARRRGCAADDRIAAELQLLDVRDGRAFARGHVPGSLNDPRAGRASATRAGFALDPERPVVVIVTAATTRARPSTPRRRGLLRPRRARDRRRARQRIETFEPIGLAELARARAGRDPGRRRARGRRADRDGGRAPSRSPTACCATPTSRRSTPSARPASCARRARARRSRASLLAARGFRRVRPVLDEGIGDVRAA